MVCSDCQPRSRIFVSPLAKAEEWLELLGLEIGHPMIQLRPAAAYNPSLSPMESTLGFMNMTMLCQSALIISEAVLVEQPPNISQRSVTEVVLQFVAPAVSLQYIESA